MWAAPLVGLLLVSKISPLWISWIQKNNNNNNGRCGKTSNPRAINKKPNETAAAPGQSWFLGWAPFRLGLARWVLFRFGVVVQNFPLMDKMAPVQASPRRAPRGRPQRNQRDKPTQIREEGLRDRPVTTAAPAQRWFLVGFPSGLDQIVGFWFGLVLGAKISPLGIRWARARKVQGGRLGADHNEANATSQRGSGKRG